MDARAVTWSALAMLLGACDGDSAVVKSVDIAAGDAHGCVLDELGAVRCWGSNRLGQLGDGTTIDRPRPVRVVGLPPDVVSIDAQGETTCALTAIGETWCWGHNHHGQLGDGTLEARAMPVRGAGLPEGGQLAVGIGHVCVLDRDGKPACRGWSVPAVVPASAWVSSSSIEAGYGASCVIDDARALHCWGADAVRPTEPIENIAAVAIGVDHTCAAPAAGGVQCWGAEPGGRGTPASPERYLLSTVTSLAAATDHVCAIDAGGSLHCWGKNDHGQLGDGSFVFRSTPTVVPELAAVRDVAVGTAHSCALDRDGRPWCWGDNEFGQLGDGTRIDSLVAVAPQ